MIVSGGVSRRTVSPAVPTSRPAARQSATTGPAGTVELGAEHQAAAADLGDSGERGEPGGELRAVRAHGEQQRLVDRLDDRAGGGARDRIAAEGAGVIAGREALRARRPRRAARRSAARSRAPSRARARRARRRAAPRRRSCPCVPSRTAPRRRPAARRARRRARARRRGSRASPDGSRPRPEPARSGSRPSPGRRAAASDSASFRRAKRATGASGSQAARLPGWPVTASAPCVRPWNEPSSATTSGLPVALRAHLSAASTASAPELQKKARAPPKRVGEQAGEPAHRLGRVEVRGVPEQSRAARARPRAARDGSGRGRRPRSRRAGRGSAFRPRRRATLPRRTRR